MLRTVLNLFAPYECLICKQEGDILCETCLPHVLDSQAIPSRCFRCQKLTDNHATCVSCRRVFPLQHVWVGTPYDNTAKQLISILKFQPDRTAAPLIAGWLAQAMSHNIHDIITYVPTSRQRVRERGFDHAQQLARHIAPQLTGTYKPLLIRNGSKRQVGARRQERLKQVEGCYMMRPDQTVAGSRVLVVDDIVTTGATLGEIARVLKKAGARSVDAVVFAQKI